MTPSSAEQPKDERASILSSATALSTPELENTVSALQDMLCDREIQAYDLDKYGVDSLVGLDKTKIKFVSLKQPSQEYKCFVRTEGGIHPTKFKCGVFHIGSEAFEFQYAWEEEQISAGTDLAQYSVFAFGPALLSAGSPGHYTGESREMTSGFGKLVNRLNEACGDVAPWKWDRNKAVQLVCWALELTGETDFYMNNAVARILEGGDFEGLEYYEGDEEDVEE